ncbi:MAG: hypothetical protein ACHQJ6_08490 [Candidatus Berkiellales bacterium]
MKGFILKDDRDLLIKESDLSNAQIEGRIIQIKSSDNFYQFSNCRICSTTGMIQIDGLNVTHQHIKQFLTLIGVTVQQNKELNTVTLQGQNKSIQITASDIDGLKTHIDVSRPRKKVTQPLDDYDEATTKEVLAQFLATQPKEYDPEKEYEEEPLFAANPIAVILKSSQEMSLMQQQMGFSSDDEDGADPRTFCTTIELHKREKAKK